ncbi:MAG: hypothetical protein QOH04_2269 [Sphingomonadales bacterium]|jgi:hypothetical protein|nr:hypothetical protein [Sphingomonadales bacterium]
MRIQLKPIRFSLPVSDVVLAVIGTGFLVTALRTESAVSRDICSSVSASFFFFLILRTIEHLKFRLQFRVFRRFFGEQALGDEFRFVYPNFVLHTAVRSLITNANMDVQAIYMKPASRFTQAYQIDIPELVAINDLEAMSEFVSLFGREAGVTPKILADDSAINSGFSFISFGLSSNECTHMYLDCVDNPLFEIKEERNEDLPQFPQYVEIRMPDGADPVVFRSTARREVGLFVRHRLTTVESERCWMFCAGVGPMATVGVARYVTRCWSRLAKQVGDEDFIAVFQVPPYSVEQAELVNLTTSSRIIIEGKSDGAAVRRT